SSRRVTRSASIKALVAEPSSTSSRRGSAFGREAAEECSMTADDLLGDDRPRLGTFTITLGCAALRPPHRHVKRAGTVSFDHQRRSSTHLRVAHDLTTRAGAGAFRRGCTENPSRNPSWT